MDVEVWGQIGSLPRFVAKLADKYVVDVTGDTLVTQAHAAGTNEHTIREKLGRLGDSNYVLRELLLHLDEQAFIAPASLNRARRALVQALQQKHDESPQRWSCTDLTSETLLKQSLPPSTAQGNTRRTGTAELWVLCRNLAQAQAAIEAECAGVYLDFLELTGTGEAVRTLREHSRTPIGLTPPRIRKPGEEKIERYLQSLNPERVLIRSLGALQSWRPEHCERVGDFSLNITNRVSAATVLEHGLTAFTPAFDLDSAQLLALINTGLGPHAEVVVHHPMPLFHTEHCVIAATLSTGKDHRDCGRPCEHHQVSLRDRAGMVHPVEADVGCRNTVFHGAAQSAASLVEPLIAAGVGRFRIELVRESADEVRTIVREYRALVAGLRSAKDLWRTLKADGHYGVVRGSLRVLNQ
jgi:putative protease